MGFLPRPSDSYQHQIEGLVRLGAARDAADAILAGAWGPDDATMAALEELLHQARLRFRWAALCREAA